jgi:hypothetical protein
VIISLARVGSILLQAAVLINSARKNEFFVCPIFLKSICTTSNLITKMKENRIDIAADGILKMELNSQKIHSSG